MGTRLRHSPIFIRISGKGGSKQRVYERGGAGGSQSDQQPEHGKDQQDRYQPPFLVIGHEDEKFFDKRQLLFLSCLFEFVLFIGLRHGGIPELDNAAITGC